MSAKNLDNCNRWRNKTVAFRVSPEESERLTKQCGFRGLPNRTISQGGSYARTCSAGQSEGV